MNGVTAQFLFISKGISQKYVMAYVLHHINVGQNHTVLLKLHRNTSDQNKCINRDDYKDKNNVIMSGHHITCKALKDGFG